MIIIIKIIIIITIKGKRAKPLYIHLNITNALAIVLQVLLNLLYLFIRFLFCIIYSNVIMSVVDFSIFSQKHDCLNNS